MNFNDFLKILEERSCTNWARISHWMSQILRDRETIKTASQNVMPRNGVSLSPLPRAPRTVSWLLTNGDLTWPWRDDGRWMRGRYVSWYGVRGFFLSHPKNLLFSSPLTSLERRSRERGNKSFLFWGHNPLLD